MAPVGSVAFDMLSWVSLAFYLLFAVVAINYALKIWAEKVMLVCIVCGALASLVLHLSILSSPSYAGEGALWKFVSLSQISMAAAPAAIDDIKHWHYKQI